MSRQPFDREKWRAAVLIHLGLDPNMPPPKGRVDLEKFRAALRARFREDLERAKKHAEGSSADR